jgi:hypothetical protein
MRGKMGKWVGENRKGKAKHNSSSNKNPNHSENRTGAATNGFGDGRLGKAPKIVKRKIIRVFSQK